MKQPYTTSPILDHAPVSVTPGDVRQWRKHLPYNDALALVQRYGKKKPLDPVAAWEKKHFNQAKETK